MVDDAVVRDNSAESRYEIRVGDTVAGFAEYERGEGLVTITHTEVDPSFEGQGLGSRLIRGALDDIRDSGLKVVPQCPFVASWIGKHEDYADLVADQG